MSIYLFESSTFCKNPLRRRAPKVDEVPRGNLGDDLRIEKPVFSGLKATKSTSTKW